jgi:hypothetical protein
MKSLSLMKKTVQAISTEVLFLVDHYSYAVIPGVESDSAGKC